MSRHYRHYPDGNYLYFVTSTVVEWIPIFLSHRYFSILIDELDFRRRNKGLLVHAYVLMPNHLHMIISSEPPDALPHIMRDLKRSTSREITRRLQEDRQGPVLWRMRRAVDPCKENDYRVWQRGYHPIAIFTPDFLRGKLDYLHANPVRKGYVRAPEEWLYSSAYDYAHDATGVMEIDRLAV
jgi:REP element-mobilizing transposase RayT